MAAVQTEVHQQGLWPRQRPPLYVYGGLACNALMADFGSDRTPLHEAASHGRLLHLRRLIAQGFDVDTPTMDGVSPLHEACLGGHYACAKFLVERGANVNVVSTDGATALFNACCSGSAACVKLLLQHGGFNSATYPLASPIHEAAKRDHKECVELLLSSGAQVDVELPLVGTALYCACSTGASACVELLLLTGADVQMGCGADSPLHAAVRGGGAGAVDLLLDFGADGCRKNADGQTPLDLSAPNSAERAALQRRGPCSLSQLCRFCIRRTLGRGRLHRAPGLFLPHRIQNFLLYQ